MKLLLATLMLVALAAAQCSSCSGCGNGKCEYPAEDCSSCPGDCGACPPCQRLCGNAQCEADRGETSCNCPEDCGVCCLDGVCREDRGETFHNCAQDCGIALNGQVVDAETRAPINNVDVMCFSHDRTYGPTSTTPASNMFAFDSVPGGAYTCMAHDPSGVYMDGFANHTQWSGSSGDQTITIAMQFKFCSIMGVTYDNATDDAVGGADVTCTGTASGTAVGPRCTSPNGLFYFVKVVPDEWCCASTADGYRPGACCSTCAPAVDQQTNIECDLPMEPLPGQIIGHVVDLTDAAVGLAAQVSCITSDGQTLTQLANPDVPSVQGFPGAFDFGVVIPPGATSCTASVENYRDQTIDVSVRRGDVIYLPFALQPRPGTITGAITDAQTAAPILGANARAICELDRDGDVRDFADDVNAEGVYSIGGLNPGVYNCRCEADSYETTAPLSYQITPGLTVTHDCVMQPAPARLFGIVSDNRGQALANATVQCIYNASGIDVAGSPQDSQNDGLFDMPNLRTYGVVDCVASLTGYQSGENRCVLTRGLETRCDLRLVETTLTVSVFDGDNGNAPMSNVAITVAASGTTCSDLADTTATDGGVFFGAVCADTYTITADAGELYVQQSVSYDIVVGQPNRQDFFLLRVRIPVRNCVSTIGAGGGDVAVDGALVSYCAGGLANPGCSCTTAADGECITPLILGTQVNFDVSASGLATAESESPFTVEAKWADACAEDPSGGDALGGRPYNLRGISGTVQVTVFDTSNGNTVVAGAEVLCVDTTGGFNFPACTPQGDCSAITTDNAGQVTFTDVPVSLDSSNAPLLIYQCNVRDVDPVVPAPTVQQFAVITGLGLTQTQVDASVNFFGSVTFNTTTNVLAGDVLPPLASSCRLTGTTLDGRDIDTTQSSSPVDGSEQHVFTDAVATNANTLACTSPGYVEKRFEVRVNSGDSIIQPAPVEIPAAATTYNGTALFETLLGPVPLNGFIYFHIPLVASPTDPQDAAQCDFNPSSQVRFEPITNGAYLVDGMQITTRSFCVRVEESAGSEALFIFSCAAGAPAGSAACVNDDGAVDDVDNGIFRMGFDQFKQVPAVTVVNAVGK